jgi:hypothetical protein
MPCFFDPFSGSFFCSPDGGGGGTGGGGGGSCLDIYSLNNAIGSQPPTTCAQSCGEPAPPAPWTPYWLGWTGPIGGPTGLALNCNNLGGGSGGGEGTSNCCYQLQDGTCVSQPCNMIPPLGGLQVPCDTPGCNAGGSGTGNTSDCLCKLADALAQQNAQNQQTQGKWILWTPVESSCYCSPDTSPPNDPSDSYSGEYDDVQKCQDASKDCQVQEPNMDLPEEEQPPQAQQIANVGFQPPNQDDDFCLRSQKLKAVLVDIGKTLLSAYNDNPDKPDLPLDLVFQLTAYWDDALAKLILHHY